MPQQVERLKRTKEIVKATKEEFPMVTKNPLYKKCWAKISGVDKNQFQKTFIKKVPLRIVEMRCTMERVRLSCTTKIFFAK